MSLPVLFVLSRDAQLAATLQTSLAEVCDLIFCGSFDEARVVLRRQNPWGVIADFRQASQGGHAEDRFLEDVRTQFPDCLISVLLPAVCPEPLERRLACSNCQGVTPPWEGQALVDAFLQQRADLAQRATQAAGPLPQSSNNPASAGTALAGATAPATAGTTMANVSTAATTSGTATAPDYVVAGLTRRFETNTPRIKVMLADLEVAARHDVTVLLIGETGAGKTFLSKLIHEISPRRNEPFLHVACGALPNDLIESELFGHSKGSFTGAHVDKEGKFVAAKRGTILLDEIDVLGLEQQVKLLRVIESGEFEPVGSNRTLHSEARLIVASNLDLQPLVEKGRFRPDLYYRLNMLKFEIPPLRVRKPDIIPLAKKFIVEHSQKHQIPVDRIDDSLFMALLAYPWPGNVRELEHVLMRAVIYCRDGVLTSQHLPSNVVMCLAGPGNEGVFVDDRMLSPALQPSAYAPATATTTLGQQMALGEREIIEQMLTKCNNSRTNTAKALGISRVTLYNKMKKYGMTK